jgi:pimeloyl-ACP methyl ester carboxylesterase
MCASKEGSSMGHRFAILTVAIALLAAPARASDPTDGYFNTSSGTPPVAAGPARTPPPVPTVDLTKVKIPVIAVIGEYDMPNARTARMQRELANFKLTVLPGKSHLTAIAARTMPKEYLATLTAFIDGNDEK